MEQVILTKLSDDELSSLPDMVKREKERRIWERLEVIPKDVFVKLQNQLKEIQKLIEFPDNKIDKIQIAICITYVIEDGKVSANAASTDIRDLDFTNNEDSALLSKSVSGKVKRIQKKWDSLVEQVKIVAKHADVPEDAIWEMVDVNGEL